MLTFVLLDDIEEFLLMLILSGVIMVLWIGKKVAVF